MDYGMSEMFNLASDPGQRNSLISQSPEMAKEVHQFLVKFMKETDVGEYLLNPRLNLKIWDIANRDKVDSSAQIAAPNRIASRE